jgi:uncharacterized membrane protein
VAAPLGNQYAKRSRVWTAAIERALAKRSLNDQNEAIDALAETLLKKVEEGDVSAIKELGDRLEGKPVQALEHSGADGGPLTVTWKSDAS